MLVMVSSALAAVTLAPRTSAAAVTTPMPLFTTAQLAPTSPTPTASRARELKLGMINLALGTTNPIQINLDEEYIVAYNVYSTLITNDDQYNYVPDLALKWRVYNATAWEFWLAPNAYYTDPRNPADLTHQVTGLDVQWSYMAYHNNPKQMGSFTTYVDHIRDVWVDPGDNLHVRVDFDVAFAPALETFVSMPILPMYLWADQGLAWSNPLPIGSGPLMVRPAGTTAPKNNTMQKPPPILYLDRNPNWHGPDALGMQVFPDTVSVTNYLNSAAMSQDLVLGTIDVALSPEPTEWLYYLNRPGIYRQSVPHAFVAEVGINMMTPEQRLWDRQRYGRGTANPLLQNQAVRVAIGMITNRSKMIEKAMLGLGWPGDTIVPKVNNWHYDFPDYASTPPAWQNHSDPVLGPYTADEEFPDDTDAPGMQSSTYTARALLASEGWRYACDGSPATPDTWPLCRAGGTDRLQFRFYTLSDVSWWNTAAEGMVADARKAGIQLDLTLYSTAQMTNSIWWPLDYDIWLWDWWFTPGSDPSTGILGSYTCKDLIYGTSNDNGLCLRDAQGVWVYDEIYNQSLSETDVVKRRVLTDEMQRMLYQSASLMYPFYRNEIHAMTNLTWTHWGDWATHPGLPEDAGVNQLLPTQVWPQDHKPPQVPELPAYTGIVNVPVSLSVVATDPKGINLLYNWDFSDQVDRDGNRIFTDDNDGIDSSLSQVNALYTQPGVYNLTLKVYEDPADPGAEWFTVRRTTVTILSPGTGSPVITGLTSSPDDPDLFTSPTVGFSAAAYDPAGAALSYKWNFGDGSLEVTTTQPTTTHTYTTADLYTVVLTVTSTGTPAQRSMFVNMVENTPPVVEALPGQTVYEGALVPFVAFASDANSRDVLNYTWDFGDGSAPGYENTVTHVFSTQNNQATQYTVTISVRDSAGHVSSATGIINVIPPGPNQAPDISTFSASPNPATTTQDVAFTLTAADPEGNALAWSIDFNGDRTIDWTARTDVTLPDQIQSFTATHRFSTSGTFRAKAWVDDLQGKNQTKTYTITVAWNDAPTVQAIVANPASPIPGELVTFTTTAADVNGDTLAYTWSFGDGVSTTGTTAPYGGLVSDTHAYDAVGSYTVRITLNDQKGGTVERTLEIQVVEQNRAPTLTDITAPRYASPGDVVLFSSDADDLNGDTLTYTWDYGEGTPETDTTTVPATITGSHVYNTEGDYTVTLTVNDGHGGTATKTWLVTIQTVIVDTTPPVTSALCAGAACSSAWYTSPVTVSLSATDDITGVASTFYRVDAADWLEYTATFTLSADGTHTVEYNSTDVAGNPETTKTVTLKVDQTPPSGTDVETGTLVSGWYTTSVTVELSGSDATSGIALVRYQIDGAGWNTYSAAFSVSTEGLHTVDYQVTDNAGLVFTNAVNINIDRSAPTTTPSLAGTAGTNGWYTTVVVVTLAADDALSGVGTTGYRVDSGDWQSYAAPFTIDVDGTHTVDFNSTDVAGHAEATVSVVVKVDTLAPVTAADLSGTPIGGWYTAAVTVTLTPSDATSGVASTEYQLDSTTWTAYTAPVAVSAEGAHTFAYRSTDNAGNVEPTNSATINVDMSGPSTMIALSGTSGANGWYTTTVIVTLSSTDGGSGVSSTWYRVDGGTLTEYSSGVPLTDGTHTVEYNATDALNNAESVKSATVKIDTVAPTATLTPAPQSPDGMTGWYKSAVSITAAGADETSGIATREYRIDGPTLGTWQTTTGTFSVPDGTHTVEVRTTDNAGLVSAVETMTLKVDATAPVLTGLTPTGTVTTSSVTVYWTGTDATSGIADYKVAVDGGTATSTGTTNSTTLTLSDGEHTITVTATDVAGNTISSDLTLTVSTAGAGPSGIDTTTIIIIVVVVAAAALGAVWFLMRRKKAGPPS